MKNAMITKLSAGQPRKEKPTAMSQLTLLDKDWASLTVEIFLHIGKNK